MITQSGNIYSIPLDQTIPPALTRDPRMIALGEVLAKQLQKTALLIRDNAGIFYRIDELGELMLDILASDLHVDWYDYGADIDEKRKLIKNSVAIHRMAGTPAGLRLAIESTHNEIELEEWFEYGGDPFYFRVGINIIDPEKEINQARLLNIVRTYKPVRAHLEDDAIVFRSVHYFLVGFTTGFVAYAAPRCGTRPRPATVGGMVEQPIIVGAAPIGTSYAAPKTGAVVAGTQPDPATTGASGGSGLSASVAAEGTAYSGPVCGGTNFF